MFYRQFSQELRFGRLNPRSNEEFHRCGCGHEGFLEFRFPKIHQISINPKLVKTKSKSEFHEKKTLQNTLIYQQ